VSAAAIVLGVGAAGLCVLGGYLLGWRRMRPARADLEARADAAQERVRRLERARSSPRLDTSAISAEISSAVRPLIERDQRTQRELAAVVASLDQRQRDALTTQLETILGPVLARERLEREMVGLSAGTEHAVSLVEVLDALARIGAFSTVVVSDEVGLPLASNRGGVDPEVHAGIASMLLTVFERAARNDQPRPLGAVFRDEAHRLVIHRVFTVQSARFVLTAVSMGMDVGPEALDPALVSIERMMTRQTWRAEDD
jgi:adenosyl cobinamide kinase/adenosyl cobinamide phosphate guanylyltransferase